MSQIHKKCFIASAGMHVLLFLVLLVGPAFLMSQDKAEDMPTLEFIPSKLIDEQFYRESSPAPTKTKAPPQQPVVAPKPPPVEQPRAAEPKPTITRSEPKPEPKYTKAEDIKINLGQRKRTTVSQPKPRVTPPRADYASAANAIRKASSSTTINMPSMPTGGGPAYANYAQAVKSIYERNWHPPDETSRDDALVKVKVVIARDGSILSATIISRSGDAAVDGSVDSTLRRVTSVPPFPAGATESKRTYTIGFNLKARRSMG